MFRPLKQVYNLSASVTSAQSHTASIDTIGYDRLCLGVNFASCTSSTAEITMTIGEGDTTSAYTNITEFVAGGVGGFTAGTPPTSTSVPMTMQFDIDLRKRKRYLLLTITPFTTKVITSWATFGTPDQGPLSDSTTENLVARIQG